jgi:flagellar basal-body rod protein FlgB
MDVNDTTVQALNHALNFRQMRQNLLSANVANAETPGYKAKRIDFEEALSNALSDQKFDEWNERTFGSKGGDSLSSITPQIYEDSDGEVADDGNTVNVEKEMSAMAENKIMYDAAVQLLNKKLAIMKYAIEK